MSAFDSVIYAVVETTSFVIGHISGRTFHIEHQHAHEVGGKMVFGVLIVVLVSITFIYSQRRLR
jgi:hypothetical protein